MIESLSYGKDNVKVFKVSVKDNEQYIISLTVQVLLSGKKLDSSFTLGDNSLVVPTDTVKNTVYFLAHQHEIDTVEDFGTHIISHFFTTYSHIDGVHVEIYADGWSRMKTTSTEERNDNFSGSLLSTQPKASQTVDHPHTFVKGGQEKQVMLKNNNRFLLRMLKERGWGNSYCQQKVGLWD
jgi:urate oxidase